MTFNSATWAVNGALISAEHPRRGTFASTGGAQGIVNREDLKVRALEVPGVGLRIAPGAALVVNGYQTVPNETYVVANDGEHTVTEGGMPPSNPAAKSYIVAVTVGDPDFSQDGHPWMGSEDPPDGEESTFQYVRVVLVEVPSGATSLDVGYPALPLARVDVPANTTTITPEMVVDLREMAVPRSLNKIAHVTAGGTNVLNGLGGDYTVFEKFPGFNVVTTRVPEWATSAKVMGFVEGVSLKAAGQGLIRVGIVETGASSPNTQIDEDAPATGAQDRVSYNVGGEIAISDAIRGTEVNFAIYARPTTLASKGFLESTANKTSAMLLVVFEEIPS